MTDLFMDNPLAVLAEVHATFGRPEVRRARMVSCERREPLFAGIVKFTERVLPIFRREEEAASTSGIHPRSPSTSFSNDDASASSLVSESARSSVPRHDD